jgi:uncharacterized iron-regulated membrane protein
MSDKRNYNIFFHLHTVSGITITVGLFIIFFAGAFTLFREEIGEWESSGKNTSTRAVTKEISENRTKRTDYTKFILALENEVPNAYGREFYGKRELNSGKFSFYISETTDTTFDKKKNTDYRFQSANGKLESRSESYSFGELLYWLHFYYQLDRIGYYISGLVAFFFFFAIITGVIVHWKKTFSNFFVFRPKQKMKTVWTDAHTALGFIGLPFQFIYALTGSMFGLGIVVAISSGAWIYNGDNEKMYADVMKREGESVLGKKEHSTVDYNELVQKAEKKWDNFEVHGFHIRNYGSSNMTIEFFGEEHISSRFLGEGKVVFNTKGEVVSMQKPGEISYYEGVWSSVRRLHYAQFGNIGSLGAYLLKTVYFVMALITCFVIATGVLIWMEARNKKNVPEKRRKYNNRVALIYLSICLSMLPVTAAVFILSKVLPEGADREAILNYSFFVGWLVTSIIFYFLKSTYLVNKFTLLIGGVLALLIPILNGVLSGSWFWSSYANHDYGVFSIDVIWSLIGVVCVLVFTKLKRNLTT